MTKSEASFSSGQSGFSLTHVGPAGQLVAAVSRVLGAGLTKQQLLRMVELVTERVPVEDPVSDCESRGSGFSSSSGASRSSEKRRLCREKKNKFDKGLVQRVKEDAIPAYAVLFRSDVVQELVQELGQNPTVAAILKKPVYCFRRGLVRGSGYTFSLGKPMQLIMAPGNDGASLVEVAAAVKQFSSAMHPTWLERVKWVTPRFVVSLGHRLILSKLASDAAEEATAVGYCYLKGFPKELRLLRSIEYGCTPHRLQRP